MAALRETLRLSATIGVEQNRPILTPGVAKRASSLATARSQLATSWQPAAVAMPLTAAITGFGDRTMASIMSEQAASVLAKKARPRSGSLRCAVSSLRSWPEEKAVPAPVMTMARKASDPPISLTADVSAPISSSDSELRASGRFSVSTATGP